MYFEPDRERLSKLNTFGLKIGDSLLFCPICDYQAPEPNIGMKAICPMCKHGLHITKVDQELLDL